MKIVGWMEIIDDYGSHKYTVTKVLNGCYYFLQKTLDGHELRYNERTGWVEYLYHSAMHERDFWDVYSAYVYQADFIKKQ